jgi:Domain of unknown function (DUF1905)
VDEQFTAALQKSPNRHKLPVKADIRRAIGKEAGDTVTVRLEERIDG